MNSQNTFHVEEGGLLVSFPCNCNNLEFHAHVTIVFCCYWYQTIPPENKQEQWTIFSSLPLSFFLTVKYFKEMKLCLSWWSSLAIEKIIETDINLTISKSTLEFSLQFCFIQVADCVISWYYLASRFYIVKWLLKHHLLQKYNMRKFYRIISTFSYAYNLDLSDNINADEQIGLSWYHGDGRIPASVNVDPNSAGL